MSPVIELIVQLRRNVIGCEDWKHCLLVFRSSQVKYLSTEDTLNT